MNGEIDLRKITRLFPVAPADVDGHKADARGWWPLLAFVDDGRPVCLEINVN